MIEAQYQESEDERLKSLRGYAVLDTVPEEEYDDLSRLAAFVCSTPMAAVTLVDKNRLWIKSICRKLRVKFRFVRRPFCERK